MWYQKIAKDSDVVVSTRIRYARNISGYSFTNLLKKEELEQIINIVTKYIDKEKYQIFNMKNMDLITQDSLREKYYISKELVGNKNSAIVMNQDNSLVCMINEEDHLRIQSFEAGFEIENCYRRLKEFSDELEKYISFSQSEKYGYLTSCPTNVGSAMRVSMMLHLPGLKKTGTLSQVLEQVSSMGFSVRGVYGENSDTIGNMYQISNRKTLGVTDQEILDSLKMIIISVIEAERKAREVLKNNISFEDEIYRSYGILKNARKLNLKEAMKLLSNVRVGVSMGFFKDITLDKVQALMIEIQSNTLKLLLKEDFDDVEEPILRARYIRKELI